MTQITIVGPDDEPVVPKANEDGILYTAPAPGTGGDASEATLAQIEADTSALASVVAVAGMPATNDPALAVKITDANTLPVEIIAGQTATATPDAGATGIVTRLAGVTTAPAGESGTGLDVVIHQGGDLTVALGPGDPGKPQYVQGVDGDSVPERLATQTAVDELEPLLDEVATIGVVLPGNSTTTPLAANAEFVGAWFDALQYVDIRVAVTTDVASADVGLVIEQSHDGIAVISDDSYAISAGRRGSFAAQRGARFIRVRYINGPDPQASFALQTILSRTAPLQSVHNIGHVDELHGEDDAQLTISVLAGAAPAGGWRAARVDRYRRLMVATAQESSPLHTVATGRVDVSTTVETLIISPPYTEQTSNAQRSVVSTSAQDGVGGTGIRSIVIEYYQDDLTGPYFETVVLNGLTPVDTAASDICYIEKMYGVTGGSALAVAIGDILLKASTGGAGTTVWSIPTGDRKARGAHHYLSPGADAHVTSTVAGVTGTGAASIYLLYGQILTANYCYQQVSPSMRVSDNGQAQLIYPSPLNIDGPGKLIMAVKRDTAPAVMTYSGAFSFYHNTDM